MYEARNLDKGAMERASEKWNSVAKPLHSLGVFEDIVINIAGIQGTENISIDKRCVLVMCSDNGVVCEGVTQTGQEVTAIVTENFAKGDTSVCKMAHFANAEVFAVDVGVSRDVEGVINKKISYGTKNMYRESAMTYSEAQKAIDTGIECVKELKEKGYKIIVTGEMGIGNTTTSAAVVSVLTGIEPEEITGRGAGLSTEGLRRKIEVIKGAIELNKPDKNDAVDVLAKVGGYDIAALCGVFLGGSIYGVPIVIDGFISAAAALCAYKICKESRNFMIASHVSGENGAANILKILDKKAPINAGMCLGEGTGGAMLLPLLDSVLCVYNEMSTFSDINVEQYKELK